MTDTGKKLMPMRGNSEVEFLGEGNNLTVTKSMNPNLGYSVTSVEGNVRVGVAGLSFVPKDQEFKGNLSNVQNILNTNPDKRDFDEVVQFEHGEVMENLLLEEQINNQNIPMSNEFGFLIDKEHPYSIASGFILMQSVKDKTPQLVDQKAIQEQYSLFGGRYAAKVNVANEDSITLQIPTNKNWKNNPKDVEGFQMMLKIERPMYGKPVATALLYINDVPFVSKFNSVKEGLDWLRLHTPR